MCGEGFFLLSPSELARFSVSTNYVLTPSCEVLLKEDARPPLPQAEPETAAVEAQPAAAATAEEGEAAAEENKDKEEETPVAAVAEG